MTLQIESGQTLLDAVRLDLGAYANAFTEDQLLYFINRGADETWAVIRSLDLDYFGDSSQTSDAGEEDYFATITPAAREYPLPPNCREPRFIECLTSGFEDRRFIYRKFEDPIFQAARRISTATGASATDLASQLGEYYYTILGIKFILAQYPETTLDLKIWYIKANDSISVESFPQILSPFASAIADYATERAVKSTQNVALDADWMQTWKATIQTLALSAGPRTSTDPIFVSDYLGG